MVTASEMATGPERVMPKGRRSGNPTGAMSEKRKARTSGFRKASEKALRMGPAWVTCWAYR